MDNADRKQERAMNIGTVIRNQFDQLKGTVGKIYVKENR